MKNETQTPSQQPTLLAAAELLSDLRSAYSPALSPRRLTQEQSDHLISQSAMVANLDSADLDDQVHKSIIAHFNTVTWAKLHTTTNRATGAAIWHVENVILKDHGFSSSELRKRREQSRKIFAAAARTERHPSRGLADDAPIHPDRPVSALLEGLRTDEVLSIGRVGDDSLTRLQKESRQALARRDRARLAAAIYLLANTLQGNGAIFPISYALATGEVVAN